jgi:hypothetical protein
LKGLIKPQIKPIEKEALKISSYMDDFMKYREAILQSLPEDAGQ